jgi:hypothetical protein
MAMNWYYEDNGVAQGPYPEAEVELKFRLKSIAEDTLLWHTGLVEWQSAEKLRPQWLKPSGPAAEKVEVKKAEEKKVAASKSKTQVEEPEEAKPTLRPTAPLKGQEPAEEGKKGILKRIFGMGKKS